MKKFTKIVILALTLLLVFGSVSVFAYDAYDTYTYSIDGLAMKSPPAYSASHTMTSYDMNIVEEKYGNVSLKDASDLFADADGNVYIADTGNNRIVVLNKYYSATATISSYVDEFGRPQTLKSPEGVYVTKPTVDGTPSQIYVCKKEPPTKRFFFIASVSRLSAYDCFMPVSVLQEMHLPDCGSEEQCLLRQLLCISLHMHLRKSGPS